MNKRAQYYLYKNVRLAWPMALNAVLMQAMLVIDTLLVAPLGEISVAAMGVAVTIVAFVLGVQLALANGSQLIISRAFGAKNNLGLHQACVYAMCINLIASLIFIVLLNISQDALVPQLTQEPSLAQPIKNYLNIAQFIFVFNALSQSLIAFVNAQGKTKVPFQAYLLELPINIGLSYAFIYLLNLGLAGAAYGTLAAICFRFLYLANSVKHGKKTFLTALDNHQHLKKLRQHFAEILPIATNFIILSIGNTLYLLLFAQLSLTDYVAVTLIFPWLKMATLFIVAWAQANAISISQALGKQKPHHLPDIVHSCLLAGFIMATLVAAVLYGISLSIHWIYPNMTPLTYQALSSIVPLYILLPLVRTYNTIAGNSLRAMGKSLCVLNIHFACQWLITLPLCCLFVLYWELPLFWAFALLPAEELIKIFPFYLMLKRVNAR